jgi:hypothetical protein
VRLNLSTKQQSVSRALLIVAATLFKDISPNPMCVSGTSIMVLAELQMALQTTKHEFIF